MIWILVGVSVVAVLICAALSDVIETLEREQVELAGEITRLETENQHLRRHHVEAKGLH